MVKLNPGTVVFEDINQELIKGQVLKPVEKNPRHNQKDPLTGRIRYRGKDRSEVSLGRVRGSCKNAAYDTD